MERIWNETIRWANRPVLWKPIAVFVIVIVVIYLSVLSFKDSKVAHNLILLAGALTGLYFVNRRTTAAEQDVTVERLTRSIEQLASEKASIRLGGILGLEQIATTQEEESKKILTQVKFRNWKRKKSFLHTGRNVWMLKLLSAR